MEIRNIRCRRLNDGFIEFDLTQGGTYETTCLMDLKEFLDGQRSFKCQNGNVIRLNDTEVKRLMKKAAANGKKEAVMKMQNIRYYDCEPEQNDIIEFDVADKNGQYVTTCVIDVKEFINGRRTFPCGNGDDVKLSNADMLYLMERFKLNPKFVKNKEHGTQPLKNKTDSDIQFLEELSKELNEENPDGPLYLWHIMVPAGVVNDALFVTKKAAEKYIEENQNKVRFEDGAHPCKIEISDSPELIRLLEIVRQKKWGMCNDGSNMD